MLLASSKTRHGHQTALALIRALEGDELLEAVNMMKCNMASLMQCRYGRVVLLGKSLATVIVAYHQPGEWGVGRVPSLESAVARLRGIPALGECALPREEDTDS